ncbi:hypothetical protein Cgig2_011136 [Carnegiea gigantea]|uniref:Transposase n=1 Tax=Carnegiea gigantea TaxID=171969 RepID=A0A9Q1H063_9CARY|nr:hypothetical protein Cgig2_011136 [Carnegiea gigantea]
MYQNEIFGQETKMVNKSYYTSWNMQKLIIERYRVAVLRYTCDRAKKLLKSWVDGWLRLLHIFFYSAIAKFVMYTTKRALVLNMQLHLLFWTTYNAYNKHAHNQAMEAIKRESVVAYEWSLGEPVEHWARYTFPIHLKCLDYTTNFIESFNGMIELCRYKPIFTLLEEIRGRL